MKPAALGALHQDRLRARRCKEGSSVRNEQGLPGLHRSPRVTTLVRMARAIACTALVGAMAACGGGGTSALPDVAVARVVVTPASASVNVGQTLNLSGQALSASGDVLSRSLTWVSSDASKATVDGNGKVTGVSAGSASITAAADAVQSAPVAVSVLAVTASQSSLDLIDAALARGDIDLDTATTYKVYATFGDTRLPATYRGDGALLAGSTVIDDLKANWAALSDATKETLVPFLVPPAYQGSWTSLPTAAPDVPRTGPARSPRAFASRVRPLGALDDLLNRICNQPVIDPNWAFKAALNGGHFKVWYDTRAAGTASKAALALTALEDTIWRTVLGTGMKTPLPDGDSLCNGGDERLDVFIVAGLNVRGTTASDLGDTLSNLAWPTQYSSVFMIMNTSLDDNELEGTLAHEFTHASQWAYKVATGNNGNYKWLKEATAEAMVDVVYPNLPSGKSIPDCKAAQFDQCLSWKYFETPDISLEDERSMHRMYGSSVFFHFLARTQTPGVIGQIWAQTASEPKQQLAVDKAIPGGFKEQWPKFAKALWNQPPVDVNSFKSWDTLAVTPKMKEEAQVNLLGQPGKTFPLDGKLKHLSSQYYRYTIPDANVRSLIFVNHAQAFSPPAAKAIVSTQAFLGKEGSSIMEYDHWSDEPFQIDGVKSYCLDLKAERVLELVIVMSNFDPVDDIDTLPVPPVISVSNVGCWRWKGSASVSINGTTPVFTSLRSSTDGSVTFERYRPPGVPNGAPGSETFRVLSGTVTGTLEGANPAGCQVTKRAAGNMTADSATLEVNLGLDMTGAGAVSRTVSGAGGANLLTHVTIACPNVDPINSTSQEDWSWFELPQANELAVEVKPDGTIQGNFTRPLESPNTGSETMTWSLTPLRE